MYFFNTNIIKLQKNINVAKIIFFREMWDAFFLLRMHTGIGYFFGTVFLFVTEMDYIREDRHVNIGISALLQFSYLVAASFFAFESVAIFM